MSIRSSSNLKLLDSSGSGSERRDTRRPEALPLTLSLPTLSSNLHCRESHVQACGHSSSQVQAPFTVPQNSFLLAASQACTDPGFPGHFSREFQGLRYPKLGIEGNIASRWPSAFDSLDSGVRFLMPCGRAMDE